MLDEYKYSVLQWMCQQGYSFDEMLEFNVTYYELLYFFQRMYRKTKDLTYLEEYYDNFNRIEIPDNKVLIISDLHMGSKEENMEYIKEAFKLAKTMKIHTILNGGDLGDGLVNPASKYDKYIKQINHILESYPSRKEMHHYLTLGNHDEKYRGCGMDFGSILERERKDITVLGKGVGYFNLFSHFLTLEHCSNKIPRLASYPLPEKQLIGHSHRLDLDKKIKIPTLSDSNPNRIYEDSYRPGFLILTMESKDMIDIFHFEAYQFVDGLTKTNEKDYTLIKKIT